MILDLRMACQWCQYSRHEPLSHSLYQCRRRPPMPVGPDHSGYWPVVMGEQWCGEFLIDEERHEKLKREEL